MVVTTCKTLKELFLQKSTLLRCVINARLECPYIVM